MPKSDYREELQLLFDAAESFVEPVLGHNRPWAKAMDRARAALSHPEPAPTDEELLELMPEEMRDDLAELSRIAAQHHGLKPGIFRVVLNTNVMAYARAVLARYGRPPIPNTEKNQ